MSFRGNPPRRAEYFWLLNAPANLTEPTKERDHSIIRFFTFEALALRHTCCIEITTLKHINDRRRYADSITDEEELQSLHDENQDRYTELDQLVEKFNRWLDELDLPIMEFVDGLWHSHMVGVLSTRDSYIEDHIRQTRDIGVFLKPAEFLELPEFLYLLGNRAEELESENAVSDDKGGDEDEKFDEKAKNGT
jgi:hypothetical protein